VRRTGPLAAALLPLLLLGALPAGAATDPDDGLWYVRDSHLDEIHRTSRGEGITVAVLDSQINPAFADLVEADLEVHEPAYCAAEEGGPALPATSTGPEADHATGIAAMLVGTGAGIDGQPGIPGVAPDITLRHYTIGIGAEFEFRTCGPVSDATWEGDRGGAALTQAIADGADIISFSEGGGSLDTEALVAAHRAGVVIVAAAGNDATHGVDYPAAFNSVVSVASLTPEGALWENNPTGPDLAVIAPGVDLRLPTPTFDGYSTGSGSSYAAPYTAGVLALAWSQHPEATGDQMIQALLRTTDGSTHGLDRDDAWGYGVVSAQQLMQIDPTTLPDQNPLLYDADGRFPPVADFTDGPTSAPTTAAPTATAEARPPASTAEDAGGGSVGTLLAITGGGAAVLAILVLALLRARRRSSPTHHHSGGHHDQQG
jgi:subtilisin family serine protease